MKVVRANCELPQIARFGADSVFTPPESDRRTSHANGHTRAAGGLRPNTVMLPWSGPPLEVAIPTAEDLLLFADAPQSGKLVSPELPGAPLSWPWIPSLRDIEFEPIGLGLCRGRLPPCGSAVSAS